MSEGGAYGDLYRAAIALRTALKEANRPADLRVSVPRVRELTRSLRDAMIDGLVAGASAAELRALTRVVTEVHETFGEHIVELRSVSALQGGIGAILFGVVGRLVPGDTGSFVTVAGILIALLAAVAGLIAARWTHIADRLGRVTEELQRACGTLPPARSGVRVDIGATAEQNESVEAEATSDTSAPKKAPR